MRLQPIQSVWLESVRYQSVDLNRISQLANPVLVLGERGYTPGSNRSWTTLSFCAQRTTGQNGNMYSLGGDGSISGIRVGNYRSQVGTAFLLTRRGPELGRVIGHTRFRQILLTSAHVPVAIRALVKAASPHWDRWVAVSTSTPPSRSASALGDCFGVPRCPDARAVHAAAALLEKTLSTITSRNSFQRSTTSSPIKISREARAVGLHARIAVILLNGLRTTEDHRAGAARQQAWPTS